MNKKISIVLRKTSLGLIAWVVCLYCFAQCPTHQEFWNKILAIDSASRTTDDKLQLLETAIQLKKDYEKCGLEKDSTYARILHRIGALQSANGMPAEAIQSTLAAIKINTSGKKSACPAYAVNSYYNLGMIYYGIKRFDSALIYYDSLIAAGSSLTAAQQFISRARLCSSNIYYNKGDYEKTITESSLGLNVAEATDQTGIVIELYIWRAKAYEVQQKLNEALNDINKAIAMLLTSNSDNFDDWADAYSCKADIFADNKNCDEALSLFKEAIEYRKKGVSVDNISTDNNNAGYSLMYKCNNITEALKYFTVAYRIALYEKNDYLCALAYNNIAQISFEKKDYLTALKQYQQTLQYLIPRYKLNDALSNPPHKEFLSLDSKNYAEILLDNKAKCLLYLYKKTNKIQFLKSSLATSLLTDSLINDLRQEQTDEQTKLYWRNDARDFFTRSIEACFLDSNATLAFHFIEKSRAVLLGDRINELGVLQRLPKAEVEKQDKFLTDVTIQKQKLNGLSDTLKEFANQQNKLYQSIDSLERFIKNLQQKYPDYYQYKYANDVSSIKDIQDYLTKNNQSFVYYFLGDTVTYILAITPAYTKFIRLSQKEFNKDQLAQFLQLCSNKKELNNHYDVFASLSNSIYTTIFKPLNLPEGRTIICMDNIVIPFEALCTDKKGENFLLNNYSFDYVYSARFLMKQFNNPAAKGNFAGFAPVSFNKNLGVAELTNAATALKSSSSYYSNDKLFTYENATRKNFFNYAASYSIVNIFSHAKADTTDSEPVLYMQDSTIHLSELQLLNNPATKLVLLSACQTNVGKTATGEGIYSLARGFAAAGIPSVSATLWNADEETIYSISNSFNKYLSEGMNKDEALQKAKLDFTHNNDKDKLLPYYWANMILIGNADAIKLSSLNNHTYTWLIIAVIVVCVFVIVLLRRKSMRQRNYDN